MNLLLNGFAIAACQITGKVCCVEIAIGAFALAKRNVNVDAGSPLHAAIISRESPAEFNAVIWSALTSAMPVPKSTRTNCKNSRNIFIVLLTELPTSSILAASFCSSPCKLVDMNDAETVPNGFSASVSNRSGFERTMSLESAGDGRLP